MYLGNVPPPSCLGFVPNPNLVLPPYIITEVHLYHDEAGVLISHRRPRPLSVVAGAEFVLQCDQERLARLVVLRCGIQSIVLHEKQKQKVCLGLIYVCCFVLVKVCLNYVSYIFM